MSGPHQRIRTSWASASELLQPVVRQREHLEQLRLGEPLAALEHLLAGGGQDVGPGLGESHPASVGPTSRPPRMASVDGPTRPRLSPWRFVVWFGVIALLGDILYEGARSITGPLLASLGASALVVGVVTGVGETAALLLRLVSGPMADRSGRFWEWTIAGYAITVVSVPLLGLASALWVACGLVILERVGKAVRAPSKDTLLSHATSATGRGKGFAVHEAIDQFGALLGPLIVGGGAVPDRRRLHPRPARSSPSPASA